MTKWLVQKLTHRTTQNHVQHHDATDIKKNYIFCVFVFNLTIVDKMFLYPIISLKSLNRNTKFVVTQHVPECLYGGNNAC